MSSCVHQMQQKLTVTRTASAFLKCQSRPTDMWLAFFRCDSFARSTSWLRPDVPRGTKTCGGLPKGCRIGVQFLRTGSRFKIITRLRLRRLQNLNPVLNLFVQNNTPLHKCFEHFRPSEYVSMLLIFPLNYRLTDFSPLFGVKTSLAGHTCFRGARPASFFQFVGNFLV